MQSNTESLPVQKKCLDGSVPDWLHDDFQKNISQETLGSKRRFIRVSQKPPPPALVFVKVGAVHLVGLFWNFLEAPMSTIQTSDLESPPIASILRRPIFNIFLACFDKGPRWKICGHQGVAQEINTEVQKMKLNWMAMDKQSTFEFKIRPPPFTGSKIFLKPIPGLFLGQWNFFTIRFFCSATTNSRRRLWGRPWCMAFMILTWIL